MSTYHAPVKQWLGFPVAPTTALGKWGVLAAVVSGLGWLVVFPAAAFGSTGEWWPTGLLLLVGGIPAFVCAIAASILAFLAMVRHGERAVSVYLGYVPVACILMSATINSVFFGG